MGFITQPIINFVTHLMDFAMSYNLNPIIFLIIYFGSGIFIIPSIHILIKIGRKKLNKRYTLLAILFLAIGWFMPYIYVVFWGQNIDLWIKIVIVLAASVAIIPYYRRKVKSKIKEDL